MLLGFHDKTDAFWANVQRKLDYFRGSLADEERHSMNLKAALDFRLLFKRTSLGSDWGSSCVFSTPYFLRRPARHVGSQAVLLQQKGL